VPAGGVVEDLDVVEDLSAQLFAVRPGAAVDQLLLQGGEEALSHGIIETVAAGSRRAGDPGFAGRLAEGERHELAAWSEW